MKIIKLNKGKETKVDDEDYEILSQVRWTLSTKGYAAHRGVRMHRFILKAQDHEQVDHINGDRLDNRKANLRLATIQQNSFNRFKLGQKTSIYKGVYWNKRAKQWHTRIKHNRKDIHIGFFKNERHAAMAYDIWAKDLFGQFAKLNF